LRFAALRGEIAVEINKAAKTRGRVEEPWRQDSSRDVELGIEWSERSIRLIHGPKSAVQLELAARGQIRRDGDRKFEVSETSEAVTLT